jgi:PqqD family protein of HPr-rel-A system
LTQGARFVASRGLRILDLGDEAVVFDDRSWDAHLLNAAASAVLDLLLQAPHSAREIEDFLREALRPEEQSEASGHARRLLAELASLGLVCRAGEDPGAVR